MSYEVEKFIKAKREDYDNGCAPIDSADEMAIFRHSRTKDPLGAAVTERLHGSQTKHTPGPWTISQRVLQTGDGIFRVVANRTLGPGSNLNVKDTVATTSLFRPDSECESNARLIAAAPELLEALKLVSRWILEQPMNQAARDLRTEHRNQAIAAIAKAEGRAE